MPAEPYTAYKFNNDNSSFGGSQKYPDPFFDIANNHIPTNIKTLFKYCHAFFHTDPFLSNVVRKVTEYPITQILYETDLDPEIKKKYDIILYEKLNIPSFLIEIGLDFNTYGNCFISALSFFKRYLVDTRTGEKHPIDSPDIRYKFKDFKFYLIDPVTREEVLANIEDEPIKSIESFKLVRWNPDNIDIDYNPITGQSRYYYSIPNGVRAKIAVGDKHMLETTPKLFLDALAQKKRIELNKQTFFHFKRPGLSEADMGWGKPMILPAIKKIYYLQLLQKGNEAIAHEHIVPKKSISPANTATLDPLTQLNLPKWTGQMEETIKKWKRDPNYIAVFPIPIGYQELGGNARGLMLTPEMKFLEEIIINSLGVPIEFIKGGASWTGSSISLRIVENMFITYRTQLTGFLNNFLIPKLVAHFNYPEIKLRFKEFRMSDAAEEKQLVLQLAEMGKLSDPKVLDAFGYSFEEIQQEMEATMNITREQQAKNSETQAEAQGRGQIILSKYQVRANIEAQREQIKQRMLALSVEIQKEIGQDTPDWISFVEQKALQMMYLPPEQQQMAMNKLSKEQPTLYGLVMEISQMMMAAQAQAGAPESEPGNPDAEKNPPNKKTPGKRESNKVKPKGEKTKGQTRGEPE